MQSSGEPRVNHCGNCTLCCKVMGVGELNKPKNEWCSHCTKQGCSIYETRPHSCREFECMWLQSHKEGRPLSNELYPRRCHFVLTGTKNGEKGIILHVDPGYPNAWKEPVARRIIDMMVSNGYSIIIAVGDKRRLFSLEPEVKVLEEDGSESTGTVIREHARKLSDLAMLLREVPPPSPQHSTSQSILDLPLP